MNNTANETTIKSEYFIILMEKYKNPILLLFVLQDYLKCPVKASNVRDSRDAMTKFRCNHYITLQEKHVLS